MLGRQRTRRAGRRGRAGTWSIGLLALGLLVWAVIDLVFAGTEVPFRSAASPAAAEVATTSAVDPLPFHHLMPDATDDLGRLVRLSGTVLAVAPEEGFWVRDLRDHIVYVSAGPGIVHRVAPGDAVNVRGVVSLFPLRRQQEKLAALQPTLPRNALVVRSVKLVTLRADGEG